MSQDHDLLPRAARLHRTITVSSPVLPRRNGVPLLDFVRLRGEERLSALFEYVVDLEAREDDVGDWHDSAALRHEVLGQPMTIRIELTGNGEPERDGDRPDCREISAIVAAVERIGGEGAPPRYRCVLRPWLWLGTLKTAFRGFLGKTVVEVLDEVLSAYAFPVEKRLDSVLFPIIEWVVQHGESDADFFQRLTETFGITYFFAHEDGQHRLVLATDNSAFAAIGRGAYGALIVQPRCERSESGLASFAPRAGLYSVGTTVADYDFRRPGADLSASCGRIGDAALGGQTCFVYPGGYVERDDGERCARLRLEADAVAGHLAYGTGALRGLAPGHVFGIADAGEATANGAYVVVNARLCLEEAHRRAGGADFSCNVEFSALPGDVPFRPLRTMAKPLAAGPQTAVVAGPAEHEIWCDPYGCVKVRFHWDRSQCADEDASPWIRVSSGWAGAEFGELHLPRVGQEVIVDFLNGDPERPIIIGRVPNQCQMPPWRLSDMHALSGCSSKELKGAGRTHIVQDDTTGEQQVQIHADHGRSQLTLGHNVRIGPVEGRSEKRGEGFELRTNAWGAMRAGRGLLVSTHQRSGIGDLALDASELASHLVALADATAELAKASSAIGVDASALHALARSQREHAATYSIAAPARFAGQAGSTPNTAINPKPDLALTSAAGIVAVAQGNVNLGSQGGMLLASRGSLGLATQGALNASVQDGIHLGAQRGELRLAAARGNVVAHAVEGDVDIAARQSVTVASTDGWVRLVAHKGIELNVEGSAIRITAAGIEHVTKGEWIAFAGSHAMPGPKDSFLQMPLLGKAVDGHCQSPFSA
jgi:type VI secretion system secreted protein VgrG